jgi:sugar phosphate isomerase/epimerase
VKGEIMAQIADYIPEIDQIGYELTVEFFNDPNNYQEYMVIMFTISGYDVYTTIT